jgi:cytochrome c oxidase subunit II
MKGPLTIRMARALGRTARTILLAALCALCALGLLAAPASAIQVAPEEAHSPNAETMTTAYWVALVVAAVVVVAIHAGLIAALVRFRAGRGREPARFAAGRGAFRPVVGVLSLLAVGLFVFALVLAEDARDVEASGPNGLGGTQTAQVGVKGVPPIAEAEAALGGDQGQEGQALEINAIAQQWVWRFEYPGHEPSNPLFSYGDLVVPVDTAVVLNIDSTDVVHSWWVPALGGQVQAAPGEVTQTWFKADEEGRYAGRSTMFSGTTYPVMRSWVEVVSVTEYQSYVEQLGRDLKEAQAAVAGQAPPGEDSL